jgi:hypothetical protein
MLALALAHSRLVLVYGQVWFRMPFLVWVTGITYANYTLGHVTPQQVLCALSVAWNGIFFMHHTVRALYSKPAKCTGPAEKGMRDASCERNSKDA